MRHIARLVFIYLTVLRYGLDELALSSFRQRSVRLLVRVVELPSLKEPRRPRVIRGGARPEDSLLAIDALVADPKIVGGAPARGLAQLV